MARWFKTFADLPARKAHYTDAQFRAYVKLLCDAAVNADNGRYVSIASVHRIAGRATALLIEQGDLEVDPDGTVQVHNWNVYQAPRDSTNALRQARHRDRSNAVSNAVTPPVSHGVTPYIYISSKEEDGTKETSTEERPGRAPAPARAREEDDDTLDLYHDLTGIRPWGKRSGKWLGDLQSEHGITAAKEALAAEWTTSPDSGTLLSRVEARLGPAKHRRDRKEKAADRVAATETVEQLKERLGWSDSEWEAMATPASHGPVVPGARNATSAQRDAADPPVTPGATDTSSSSTSDTSRPATRWSGSTSGATSRPASRSTGSPSVRQP